MVKIAPARSSSAPTFQPRVALEIDEMRNRDSRYKKHIEGSSMVWKEVAIQQFAFIGK